MDQDFVRQLELDCERALAKVVDKHVENLPPHIAHLMAKAAVSVLEAVLED